MNFILRSVHRIFDCFTSKNYKKILNWQVQNQKSQHNKFEKNHNNSKLILVGVASLFGDIATFQI